MRRAPGDDRRRQDLALTEAGERALAAADATLRERLAEALAGLPAPEADALARSLALVAVSPGGHPAAAAAAPAAAAGPAVPPSPGLGGLEGLEGLVERLERLGGRVEVGAAPEAHADLGARTGRAARRSRRPGG